MSWHGHHGREYDRLEEHNGYKFIRLNTGRLMSFWEMMTRADRDFTAFARAVSRCFKLVGDDYDLERLEDRVEQMEEYARSLREEITKRYHYKNQRERIAALRNVKGRTTAEAAAFLAKADELERKLKET